MSNGLEFVVRSDLHTIGDTYWGPGDPANTPIAWNQTVRDPVNVVDLRVGLQGDDWSATLWAKNLFDEEYNDEAAEVYGSEGAYDPPATLAALSRLTAPVLLLTGELDGAPNPELAHRTAAVFPHAEVAVQPGAGHYPWVDDPAWFADRVSRFLDGRPQLDGRP